MTSLPGWRANSDGRRDFMTAMAEWVYSPAMADLVAHFGGGPVPRPLDAALRYLDDFSAVVWDFRRGKERHQSVVPDFDRDTVDRVCAHGRTLGLCGTGRPNGQRYDYVLVLGGRIRACRLRTQFAAELLADSVSGDDVVGLGSLRPMDEAERRQVIDLGTPPALVTALATEFDAMDLALTEAFSLVHATAVTEVGGDPPDHPRTGWRLRRYPGPPRVRVVAAPSSQPEVRRANTADTLTFWARTADVTADHRLLVVTSAIHAPFQHCDAVRVLGLPFGCAIDTVGAEPPAAGTGPTSRDAAQLLQEIRSTIRSMVLLRTELVAVAS